jgi:hypothetical protein
MKPKTTKKYTKSLSLHGVPFEDALKALIQTKPEPKKGKKPKKR